MNKVLIIDDEQSSIKMLKRNLESEDYEIISANNGKEGLHLYYEQNPIVTILDLNMPIIDGLQFLELIDLKPLSFCSIIILTGYGTDSEIKKCFEKGASTFLRKPCNILELNGLIRNFIVAKKAEIELKKHRNNLEQLVKKQIDELKNKQRQIIQSSKLASLGEMATGMVHEINQPLGGIKLVSDYFKMLLKKNNLTTGEIEEGINDIDASVKRISRITDHVRTFARQEDFKLQEVDVHETINAAMILLHEKLRISDIEVIKDFAADLPKINGDPFQLEQVWINLIVNAKDALIEKDSCVSKNVQYHKCLKIKTKYNKNNNSVSIIFKDNGTGLKETIKNKIYEPFFTTKKIGDGTGIGLSISHEIIHNHNGKIKFNSIYGEGTEFIVILK